MGEGVYTRGINSSDMIEENISGENILAFACDLETKKPRCDYALFYSNWNNKKHPPSLTIADGDKVLSFNRSYVHKKIEKFLEKKKEPNTNRILFEQPLNIKEIGRLVKMCEESFNISSNRLFLKNLPEDNKFPTDKISYKATSDHFYRNASISFVNYGLSQAP